MTKQVFFTLLIELAPVANEKVGYRNLAKKVRHGIVARKLQ